MSASIWWLFTTNIGNIGSLKDTLSCLWILPLYACMMLDAASAYCTCCCDSGLFAYVTKQTATKAHIPRRQPHGQVVSAQTQIGPTTHSLAHVEWLCINSPDHTNQFPALALRSPLQILIQQQADILAGCQRQHEPSKALPAHESETDGLGAASSAVSNVVPVELSLASRKQWVFSIH